jgi:uncharacterized MAPEG superfamily protein
MNVELKVLALAGLWQVVQYVLMAVPVNKQLGTAYTGGNRDEPRVATGMAGRMKRALDNHFEGLIMFTLAVVVVTLGGRSSALTEYCAWAYLAARVAYVPAYASGVPLLRSAIWTVGFAATVIMLVVAILPA